MIDEHISGFAYSPYHYVVRENVKIKSSMNKNLSIMLLAFWKEMPPVFFFSIIFSTLHGKLIYEYDIYEFG